MRLFLFLGLGLLRLGRFPAETDTGDLDPGQLPPMSDGAVITFAAAIFESNDLLVLALLDDFACNGCPLDQRAAVGDLVAIRVEKHIGEHPFFAGLFIEKIDIDDVAFRDTVLPAACFDNCVSHKRKSRVLLRGKSRAKSHGCAALTSGKPQRRSRGLSASAWRPDAGEKT